jgi:hypothetical protein
MYILYPRPMRVTGRLLRRQLECHGGMPTHYATQRESLRVVRWGSTEGEDSEIVCNTANAVALAANKLESLRTMKEAGVNVPRFSTSPMDFGEGAIIFGRNCSHRGGRDIRVLHEYHTEAIYSDFFTEYIPCETEFRLHIFGGELIAAQVKKYEGEGEEDDVRIRNHANGYVFVPFVHSLPHRRRIDAAAAAIASLGLHFGAVDMLGDDSSTVLEVNTAPGLSSERTLEAYAEAIRAWAQQG